jgi:PhoPQ-activated pathogenicity-related protein
MKYHLRITCLLLAVLCRAPAGVADLKEYVTRPDASYAFEITETESLENVTRHTVRMTSQTWQEIRWQHWMLIFRPAGVEHPDWGLLLVHGGDNSEEPRALQREVTRIMAVIAGYTKSVVSVIFQVPNQPLMDGRHEDELIAFTYDKYLKGEGEDWPLLFPMTKSAVRAMDTVQAVVREKHDQEIGSFLVTGGSKRGWTTWLTAAAGDERVKAIAPMIIDVLNMNPQMKQQLAAYGGYSSQVEDYTRLRIQERMDTPRGRKLLSMVDPYAYRHALTLPKLIMLGANDPYWTVDAANLYWPALRGEKHLYYQANTGHDISPQGVATITQFYNAQMTGQSFPDIDWIKGESGKLDVMWEAEGGEALLWQAFSKNRDFRESVWNRKPLEGGKQVTINVLPPETGWTAFYVEVQFPGHFGMKYGTCTQMTVLPDIFPESGRFHDSE